MDAGNFTDSAEDWSETVLRARLARSLHREPSAHVFDPRDPHTRARSDFDLSPEAAADIDTTTPPRLAAVLVPIILREPTTVLLTERAAHLARHASQIAFPGGRLDDTDADPLSAALRETEEEVGIDRAHVEPIGYLDNYRTGTGFQIIPVVGLVRPSFELRVDASEVADVFEVPLRFLMSAENHQRHQREWRGRLRTYYAMPYGERYIWGATAGMLKNLHDMVTAK